jgi:hypothetical protein
MEEKDNAGDTRVEADVSPNAGNAAEELFEVAVALLACVGILVVLVTEG